MIFTQNPGETREQFLERIRNMPPILGQPGPIPGWNELMKEVEEEEKKKKKDVDS